MRILVASTLFILSLVTVVFLSKWKVKFKVPIIVLCILIMTVTAFFDAIWIYWNRIERGAELFLRDSISSLNSGILPPLVTDISDNDKMQIEAMINNLPKENYTLEYNDFWVRMFEYYVHYEGGKSFKFSVEAPDMGLFFGRTRYELLRCFEIKNNKAEDSDSNCFSSPD